MDCLPELIECSLLHLIMRVDYSEVAICRPLRVYTSLGGRICTSVVSCLPRGRIRLAFIVLRRSRKWTFHDRLFTTRLCYGGCHANTRLWSTRPTLININDRLSAKIVGHDVIDILTDSLRWIVENRSNMFSHNVFRYYKYLWITALIFVYKYPTYEIRKCGQVSNLHRFPL